MAPTQEAPGVEVEIYPWVVILVVGLFGALLFWIGYALGRMGCHPAAQLASLWK